MFTHRMNITSKTRAQRVIQVKKIIMEASKNGKVVSYTKLIAVLMSDYYISRRTAIEYIHTLIGSDFCVKKGDDIYVEENKIIDDVFSGF